MTRNPVQQILGHRELIWEMALRDLKSLNKGSILGILWLVLNPLIQTSVYIFIVTTVLNVRSSASASRFTYAVYVLSGMIPWQVMTKSLLESPSLLREKIDLLKQVIYPIETLPINSMILASFGSMVSLALLLVMGLFSGELKATAILLPVHLSILFLFILGSSWILSVTGVLVKDLREVVTVILNLMVYFSPVILAESMVSAKVWALVQLNPLSHPVICFRDILFGTFHPQSWALFSLLAFGTFSIGLMVIRKTRLRINEYI